MHTALSGAKANYFERQASTQPKQLLTDNIFSRLLPLISHCMQIDITLFNLVTNLLKILGAFVC